MRVAGFCLTSLLLVGCATQHEFVSAPPPQGDIPSHNQDGQTPVDQPGQADVTPAEAFGNRPLYAGPILPTGTNREMPVWVRAAETALSLRGYYGGPLDGMKTALYGDALRRFQADAGLAVSGRLDDATADALGLQAR